MKRWVKIVLFCVTAFVFVGCDRITKDLAKEHLKNQVPVSYFNNSLKLIYAENTGAAYNLGEHLSKSMSFWLLSMLPLGILCVLFAYAISKSGEMKVLKLFSFALIFAGGIGNIIDRILFDRHVTDFMHISLFGMSTAIFNFADVYITFGAILLLGLQAYSNYRKGAALL